MALYARLDGRVLEDTAMGERRAPSTASMRRGIFAGCICDCGRVVGEQQRGVQRQCRQSAGEYAPESFLGLASTSSSPSAGDATGVPQKKLSTRRQSSAGAVLATDGGPICRGVRCRCT